jgi:hypothetical protein
LRRDILLLTRLNIQLTVKAAPDKLEMLLLLANATSKLAVSSDNIIACPFAKL